MLRRRSKSRQSAAFTLVEVMITMFLMTVMCLGAFMAMQQITKSSMGVAARDEAYHLLESKVEEMLAAPYTTVASYYGRATVFEETLYGALKTSYTPATTQQSLTVPATNSLAGRVAYKRRIIGTANSTAGSMSTSTLRIEVEWSWQGRSNLISAQVYRTNSS